MGWFEVLALVVLSNADCIDMLVGESPFYTRQVWVTSSLDCVDIQNCLFRNILPFVSTNPYDGYGFGSLMVWIRHDSQPPPSRIRRCEFVHCSANRLGGGVYFQSTKGNLSVSFCCGWNCSASQSGHFAYLYTNHLTSDEIGCVSCGYRNHLGSLLSESDERGCLVLEVDYSDIFYINCTFCGGYQVKGSAIFVEADYCAGNLISQWLILSNNLGSSTMESTGQPKSERVQTINNATFIGNNASQAVFVLGVNGKATMRSSYFQSNISPNDIFLTVASEARLSVTDCVFGSDASSWSSGTEGITWEGDNIFQEACCRPFTYCQFQLNTWVCQAASLCYSARFKSTRSFSATRSFSMTKNMPTTLPISGSRIFGQSNDLPKSSFFSRSHFFSSSRSMTQSQSFSRSRNWSRSRSLSRSSFLRGSSSFASTSFFSFSRGFAQSSRMTNSRSFSGSRSFSRSLVFGKTVTLRRSSAFANSIRLTSSRLMSVSGRLRTTAQFSKTRSFDSTKVFGKSLVFSLTHVFESTKMVHVTSAEFSSSKTFTDSFGFSGTDVLSSTGEFTSSASISASDLSGKTSIFTFSGYNRLSRNFTETKNVFSPSNLFSVSNEMTETSVFSSSSLLSLSEIFHFSKQITRSRPFAKSGVFGKTRALSLSMAVKGSSFFSRTDTFTDSVWSLIPSDRFVGTVGFDRTSEFYATDDVFTNSTAFDGTLEFARTAALQRSAYPDLESVWGYLMACVALMGLGTALLMRGLILLQKLGAGLHIQSDVGEASSDYTDDSSDEMSDLNWEM